MQQHHPVIGTFTRLALPCVLALFGITEAGAQEGTLGTGGIRGVVRDSTGQAIIGAQVTMPGKGRREFVYRCPRRIRGYSWNELWRPLPGQGAN